MTEDLKDLARYLKRDKSYKILVTSSVTGDDPIRMEVCSACYTPFEHTWDHADWCEYYEQEPLNKFLEDGRKDLTDE